MCNRQTNAVSEPALLVIKATRSWVRAIMSETCVKARQWHLEMWDECFEAIDNADAPHLWSSFMRHLTLEGSAKFSLGCGGCGRASKDEHKLVHCLAAHQAGRKTEAYTILSHWFTGDSLWRADALIEAFADLLSMEAVNIPYGTGRLPVFELAGSVIQQKTMLN